MSEVHCIACKSVLLDVPLWQTSQLNKPSSVKYALYATVVKNRGLNSPFSRYNPIVHTVDGAFGIFLTVKGYAPVSGHIEKQCSAGKDAEDATLASTGCFYATARLVCGALAVLAGGYLAEAFDRVSHWR